MPENRRIMSRRERRVNRRAVRLAWIGITFSISVLAMMACGGDRRAERLYREASELVEKGDTAAAVPKLEEIVRDHPDSEIAERARREIVLYRGLSEAVAAYPVRRASDLVVQTARAIERFRGKQGAPPDDLAALVPAYLPAAPVDPWGAALQYQRNGEGYRLACLGADGSPGGEGEAADVVVQNGAFVRRPQ